MIAPLRFERERLKPISLDPAVLTVLLYTLSFPTINKLRRKSTTAEQLNSSPAE